MGVLGGLALVLAVANGSIWQREQLLGSGRVVILELAPVDPRSLMQGDYMALTFAAGREVTRLRKDGSRDPALTQDEVLNYEPDGYLVLAQDERGVGKVLRIQPGTPAARRWRGAAALPRARQQRAHRHQCVFLPRGPGQAL